MLAAQPPRGAPCLKGPSRLSWCNSTESATHSGSGPVPAAPSIHTSHGLCHVGVSMQNIHITCNMYDRRQEKVWRRLQIAQTPRHAVEAAPHDYEAHLASHDEESWVCASMVTVHSGTYLFLARFSPPSFANHLVPSPSLCCHRSGHLSSIVRR